MNPKLAVQLDAVWSDIDKAVAAGLKDINEPTLDQVVPLVERPTELSRYINYSWTAAVGDAAFNVKQLTVSAEPLVELSSSKSLGSVFDGLSAQQLGDIRAWAKHTREKERKWLIGRIAAEARPSSVPLVTAIRRLDKAATSWRVVTFAGETEDAKKECAERGIDFVDASGQSMLDSAALIFPIERFSFARLEDFTLSWGPSADGSHVQLNLDARLNVGGFALGPVESVLRLPVS